ncbi:hypothetical protein NQ315_008988 [Exocentrus adspersus]|uniref:SWIM-type domain-containing protein n=1 Tax=Exocentrus adspersus TaxID=1586481 RepID=A0AAV8V716_9CUCU|nr:hypothetical protein NQ315_008988 [Exocentrus adspersus]
MPCLCLIHLKSKEIIESNVNEISENNSWAVKSSSNDNQYTVTKLNDDCVNDCQLTCKFCKICIHMYSCTCPDNFVKGNLCKHIHAVCTKLKLPARTVVTDSPVIDHLNSLISERVTHKIGT